MTFSIENFSGKILVTVVKLATRECFSFDKEAIKIRKSRNQE